MASAHSSLDAAATERKARLAKLKSLKRKQPEPSVNGDNPEESAQPLGSPTDKALTSPPPVTSTYLSGRNYDSSTRGPRLGFEINPAQDQKTIENQAAQIAEETNEQAQREEQEEKPIDLFKLQPKKPNWDLKRDVARKMEILNTRTDNAIARLVRERIEGAKKKAQSHNNGNSGEEVGMKGEELVEGIREREREEQEERNGFGPDEVE
ncbi:MAG: hypothetical protein Q9190_005391 [Brigantiaea leucoxantha]